MASDDSMKLNFSARILPVEKPPQIVLKSSPGHAEISHPKPAGP
jgi:hypothetical protein